MANGQKNDQVSELYLAHHPLYVRIWHWLTALFLTGSMFSILLVSTIITPGDDKNLIVNLLSNNGIEISERQALQIAFIFEDRVMEIHEWLGYGIALLFLSRILIELMLPKKDRFITKYRELSRQSKAPSPLQQHYIHYLWVKRAYLFFYFLLFLITLSGLSLTFGEHLNMQESTRHTIREMHELIQYALYGFGIMHVAGVVFADCTKANGLISGMIHGNKKG